MKDNSIIEDPIYLKINKLFFKNELFFSSYNKINNTLNLISSLFKDSFYQKNEKPKIIEVLEKNYLRLEKELKNLKENESKNEIIKLEQAFQSLSHISLNYHIKKFSSSILDMAEKLGKKVGFNVIGDEVSVSKEKLHILQDIFTHIFRNSIDHGIEFPQERINSDKDEEGFISVNIEKTDETYFNLVIRDDGKGFNLNDIKRKAIEKGLVTKDQAKKCTKSKS